MRPVGGVIDETRLHRETRRPQIPRRENRRPRIRRRQSRRRESPRPRIHRPPNPPPPAPPRKPPPIPPGRRPAPPRLEKPRFEFKHSAVSRHDVTERIAAIDARWPVEGPAIDASQRTGREWVAARGSIERAMIDALRSIAADIGDVWAISDVRPLAGGRADIAPIAAARLQRLRGPSAAEIRARLRAPGDIAATMHLS